MPKNLTSKELTELYEKAKADALKHKPPKITLQETIQRCYLLSSPPGTPPLKDASLEMIASGARMWTELHLKHEDLPRNLRDIEAILGVHRMNEELEAAVTLLKSENKRLHKLVKPKKDAP